MYGVGPSVANVTANGEEIVGVTEYGLCSQVCYMYNSDKIVHVRPLDGGIIKIFSLDLNNLCCIDDIESVNKNKYKYITVEEEQLLLQDAQRRYRRDHRISRTNKCNLL